MIENRQTLAARTLADSRWQRVLARDASADGAFLYSVKTTGVYCRPSCGARPARPENVAFHADAAAARAAGFRPCKRCKPDQPSLAELHAEKVAALCRHIEQAEATPTLAQLAARAGMSPFHLQRIFKSVTGVSPRDWARAQRARRFCAALAQGGRVTDAVYDAGYASNSRPYAEAPARLGMTPRQYRAGGRSVEIRFAVGESSLGAVLVAASRRGVCAILLGEEPEALVRDLQDRFPDADLIGNDPAFESTVARVLGVVEQPRLGLDLPLDLRGTAFQQRVWQALREIPAGSTASYAEIARRIGQPRAARAVAQACGANPVAVAVPCHRVVRNDGALSGYRWGVARKRALLDRESPP